MNEGPIKPTNSLDEQERKRRLQRLLPAMLSILIVCIAGFVLAVFSCTLNVSHTASIVMMTSGGLCWGISIAIWLRMNLPTMIMQQGKGAPSKELQFLQKLSKVRWLPIAVIIFYTAVMFVLSLLLFHS